MVISIFDRIIYFLAVGFGSGLAPWAPGTFGTVAAIPVYLVMAGLSLPLYLAVMLAMAVMGVGICHRADDFFPGHDSSRIVWDEIVGFLITMTAAPLTAGNVLLGFLLFRFFDVLKPWPISAVDRQVDGGLGIMLDDMLAGVAALLVMTLLQRNSLL